MKPEVTEARVSFSTGTALLLSVLTVLLCAALLYNQVTAGVAQVDDRPRPRRGDTGSMGSISAKEVEDKYGPVNHTAASELKQGLFFRRRSSCATQASSQCSQLYSRSYARSSSYYAQANQYRPQIVTYSTPIYSSPACSTILNSAPNNTPCDSGSCPPPLVVIQPPAPAPEVAVRPLPSEGPLRIVPSI